MVYLWLVTLYNKWSAMPLYHLLYHFSFLPLPSSLRYTYVRQILLPIDILISVSRIYGPYPLAEERINSHFRGGNIGWNG